MSQLTKLKQAENLSDVAHLLGNTARGLAFILYHKDPALRYRTFNIPKRNGGERVIHAPSADLKKVQSSLANLLQNCLDEISEVRRKGRHYPARLDELSHGFYRGRSIRTNARQHRARRYVFNIDLEDFFPSINFGRVYGLFLKDRAFLLNPRVAAVLAAIACHDGGLPQGSPCSPVISNLIGRILDARIAGLAARTGCMYTRYADDLSFSTNRPIFPPEIAQPFAPGSHCWEVGPELRQLVEGAGFGINAAKTRMQYRDSRQEVTGLVVNKRINVRSEYRRTVRAMVHHLFTTGSFEIMKVIHQADGRSVMERGSGSVAQLHGMLGFIETIDGKHLEDLASSGVDIPVRSTETMYKQFLLYKHFYNIDMPMILCEGITDNIYLRCAIRALRANYPMLAKEQSAEDDLCVRFYKYLGTGTDRILGLASGGTGNLPKFVSYYRSVMPLFKAPGGRHPVIIIVDNDFAGRSVMSVAKEITGVSFDANQDFAHLFRNVYLIATHPKAVGALGGEPQLGNARRNGKGKTDNTDSCMEDYFSEKVRSIKITGRTFSVSNTLSSPAHYGKMEFARKVVDGLHDEADFDGFRKILDRIKAVIDEHARKHRTA